MATKAINNQKNVGHASRLVNGHTYVSWWPDEAAGVGLDFHPIRNRSFAREVADEGCAPDMMIYLRGLDEDSILNWCEGFGLLKGDLMFQGPLQSLEAKLLDSGATALKKGGS